VDVHDAVLAAERVVRNFVDSRRGGDTGAGANAVEHASVNTLTINDHRTHVDAPALDMGTGPPSGVGGETCPSATEV